VSSPDVLFQPFTIPGKLVLPNRIVMAPMTRSHSPGGVPGTDVAAYYRRRAEGGVGLIITEGTYVAHPAAGFDPNVPRFHGAESLAGWRRVAEQVHAAGGLIFPQLWHVGMAAGTRAEVAGDVKPMGPATMTDRDIADVIAAFGVSAASAKELGFDGVELHGAHGYLIDQFFFEKTNPRTDGFGGDLVGRTRFGAEVIREVRRRIGPDFPLVFRYSQWKLQDYDAMLARTPRQLELFLQPLVDAGVDVFHCSQRRFWEPAFPDSDLNLAGWTKKLTGKPTITVGSVTLDEEFMTSFRTDDTAGVTGIDELLARLQRGEFDLVALGRSLIVNPDWPKKVRSGQLALLKPFQREALKELV
jgi:2,4-dienoyl-CoA reductase-like NADH-dependent reductase (Old Yellow Enzyme family)